MLPREKMIKYGAKTLAEYELLAIILGSGNKSDNVFNLAKKIIESVDNIKELLDLSYEELIAIKGIKMAKATKIIASIEFAKRIFEYKPNKLKLLSPQQIYSLMRFELENKKYEEFFVLYLDKRYRLIKKMCISSGSDIRVGIDVKTVLKQAVILKSNNIVLLHNHPSGTLEASDSDVLTTKFIIDAAKTLEVNVIDHIIISIEGYYSFKENHII